MASARYQLPQHPTLSGPHTKEELYLLVERGSLGRGEFVTDRLTGRSHKVGELIGGMRPPRPQESVIRTERPAYQEFSGDTPWEPIEPRLPVVEPQEQDGEDEDLDDDEADWEEESGGIDEAALCYHGHPSWLSYAKPMLLCLLLVGASTYSLSISAKYFIIGILLTSCLFCCIVILRQQRDYFITNESVEVEWGVIGRRYLEIPMNRLRSLGVRKKGLLGFLGVGTVEFSSVETGEVEMQFKHVRNPHRIQELVLQLQRRVQGQL
jgi:hypothetical protein